MRSRRFAEQKIRLIQRTVNTATALAVALAILLFARQFLLQQRDDWATFTIRNRSAEEFDKQIARANSELARIQEATSIQRQVVEQLLSKHPNLSEQQQFVRDIAQMRADQNTMKSDIANLKSTLNALNDLIQINPEKAIALPLFKKDIDDLKANTEHDAQLMRVDISRANQTNLWLIGFVLTTLIATVINNTIQSRRSRPEKTPPHFE